MEFVLLAMLLFCGVIYLLPAIIAFRRKHPNRFIIAALNTMTGLTVLGWYLALRASLSVPPITALPAATAPAQPKVFTSEIESQGPALGAPEIHAQHQRRRKMGLFKSVGACLRKYAVFEGRASRSEIWWFVLFCFAWLGLGAVLLGQAGWIFALPIWLPLLAASARRLHDIDKSGWWAVLGFVPLLQLLILYWHLKRGTDGENRFGPDPLSTNGQKRFGAVAGSVSDKTGQLQKLKALFDDGAITADEFEQMKKQVLVG